MADCIGGVIFYTMRLLIKSQIKKILEIISDQGSHTGIKVDTGAKVLAGFRKVKRLQKVLMD